MNTVQHHQSIRRRMYKNLEPFPHQNPLKRFLDRVIFLIGALGPILTIPQVYILFTTHNAAGVSTLSWCSYFIFSIIWVVYGIAHKERAITFTYTLWVLMNGLVALGSYLY